jgi:hypothetical protein
MVNAMYPTAAARPLQLVVAVADAAPRDVNRDQSLCDAASSEVRDA